MIRIRHITAFIVIALLTSCGGDSLNCGKRRYSSPDILELKEKAAKQEIQVKAGRLEPGKLSLTYQQLGEKYLAKKMWNPAIETFHKTLELGRDNSLVHYSLGVAYGNRFTSEKNASDMEKAEYHYRQSLKITPSYKSAAYGLAILLFYIKEEKKEAIGILETLVTGRKAMYREKMALGRFYFDAGETSRALSHYQSLCNELDASRESPEIKEYRRICRDNVDKLMSGMPSPKGGR